MLIKIDSYENAITLHASHLNPIWPIKEKGKYGFRNLKTWRKVEVSERKLKIKEIRRGIQSVEDKNRLNSMLLVIVNIDIFVVCHITDMGHVTIYNKMFNC